MTGSVCPNGHAVNAFQSGRPERSLGLYLAGAFLLGFLLSVFGSGRR